MNRIKFGPAGPLRASALGFLASFTVLPLVSASENGRDFSAFYDVRDVSAVDPSHVSLALVVRVHNHSGAAVANAQIVLLDSVPGFEVLGSFSAELTAGDKEVLERHDIFTIPLREFDLWRRGPGPHLELRYVDSSGQIVYRMIEVARMPGLGVADAR